MVVLRRVVKEDIAFIYRLRNNPTNRKQMFSTGEITPKENRAFWEKRLREGKSNDFIIELAGKAIGLLRLDYLSPRRREIGIIVSREYQGHGIGTDALEEGIKIAKKLGVTKMEARVKPTNAASIKIFEKAGFKREYLKLTFEGLQDKTR